MSLNNETPCKTDSIATFQYKKNLPVGAVDNSQINTDCHSPFNYAAQVSGLWRVKPDLFMENWLANSGKIKEIRRNGTGHTNDANSERNIF